VLRPVQVWGFAWERDIFDPDAAFTPQDFAVQCQKGTIAEARSVDVTVTGILNHQSIVSFDYDLTCTCLD
jgi:hypothetical protein